MKQAPTSADDCIISPFLSFPLHHYNPKIHYVATKNSPWPQTLPPVSCLQLLKQSPQGLPQVQTCICMHRHMHMYMYVHVLLLCSYMCFMKCCHKMNLHCSLLPYTVNGLYGVSGNVLSMQTSSACTHALTVCISYNVKESW